MDEMRLPEKVTFTLPKSDASSMQAVVKVLKGNLDGETLLKTEQLTFSLSMVSSFLLSLFSSGSLVKRQPMGVGLAQRLVATCPIIKLIKQFDSDSKFVFSLNLSLIDVVLLTLLERDCFRHVSVGQII